MMICRLCLIGVNVENKVSLFNGFDVDGESEIVKMIVKYLHFEVSQHDAISTTICLDCSSHLEEFHKFCCHVEEKQGMLRNEFLEVKCDMEGKETGAISAPNEELLCDIEDILEKPNELELKCEAEEHNIFEETFSSVPKGNESSNDDIPLIQLIKPSTRVKITENQRKSKGRKSKKVIASLKRNKETDLSSNEKLNKIAANVATQQVTDLSTNENFNETDANVEPNVCNGNLSEARESIKTNAKFSMPSVKDMEMFIAQHMQLKCDICDMHFESYKQARPHYKEKHNQPEYIRCCGSRHIKRRDLFDHIKWHLDPAHFQCSVCGKLMKSRNCLSMHMITKHQRPEDLIYNCDHCQKRFARPSMLNHHLKTHEGKRTFLCQHCNKSFLVKNALDKHIQSMHDNIFPHICDVCGMKFKFKPSFKTHILQHQGIVEPPAKCPECGDWVKNKNRLRLHMTTHNKVDVDCKLCGRVCASLSALRGHIQYMHRRLARHRCTYCVKSFKTPKNLKEHIATHTGESLYSCLHCSKEFRSSANMYAHVKRQHTQEWGESRAQAAASATQGQTT